MYKRFWWGFLVMAVATPILGLLISATITYVMPKKYESTAIIQFSGNAAKGIDPGAPGFQPLQEHIQAMQGDVVLLKVAENLELPNKWGVGRTEILQQLRKVIQIQPLRETDLVGVRVRHTNKEDARDIAAELVRVYGQILKEVAKKKLEKILAELRKTQGKLEKQIDELDQLEAATRVRADGESGPDKAEWDSAQNSLTEIKFRIKMETISLKIGTPVMSIHEEPVIGQIPVSPNVRFNLLTGVLGGLFLSPLLALPLNWLLYTAHRKKPALPV